MGLSLGGRGGGGEDGSDNKSIQGWPEKRTRARERSLDAALPLLNGSTQGPGLHFLPYKWGPTAKRANALTWAFLPASTPTNPSRPPGPHHVEPSSKHRSPVGAEEKALL